MAEKLIRLPQLQRFKTDADAKYQDKLTAGSNIVINGNTISSLAAPLNPNAGSGSEMGYVAIAEVTELGSITLAPGKYFLTYSCLFGVTSSSRGYRACGFSTNNTDLTGFGRGWGDTRNAISNHRTSTRVSGVFEVSASSYPNGRTFYFLAYHNYETRIYCYADYNYVKLA